MELLSTGSENKARRGRTCETPTGEQRPHKRAGKSVGAARPTLASREGQPNRKYIKCSYQVKCLETLMPSWKPRDFTGTMENLQETKRSVLVWLQGGS